jgi:hypothetical protein
MCPFCLTTTVGLVVAGTVSTGGLTALAVKLSRKPAAVKAIEHNSAERSNEDGNPHSR